MGVALLRCTGLYGAVTGFRLVVLLLLLLFLSVPSLECMRMSVSMSISVTDEMYEGEGSWDGGNLSGSGIAGSQSLMSE